MAGAKDNIVADRERPGVDGFRGLAGGCSRMHPDRAEILSEAWLEKVSDVRGQGPSRAFQRFHPSLESGSGLGLAAVRLRLDQILLVLAVALTLHEIFSGGFRALEPLLLALLAHALDARASSD